MATATLKKTNPDVKRPASAPHAPELFTPQLDLSPRDIKLILDTMEKPPNSQAKMKRAAARFNRLMGKIS
jgi:uncharacterized protein (DUF1778 family)